MRVALITNSIPSYRESLYETLNDRLGGGLRVVTTLPAAPCDRGYQAVKCGYCLNIPRRRSHPLGYADRARTPIPWSLAKDIGACDAVVAHGLGIAAVVSMREARRQGVPLILWATLSEDTERGRGSLVRFARRRLLQRASAVIVNGASGRRYVEGLLGGRLVPVIEVPYTIDTKPFATIAVQRSAEARNRILTTGQLIPRKGLLEFAGDLAEWLHGNPEHRMTWSIVGDGPLRDALTSFKAHPRLRMTVCPAVRYDRLPAVYAAHGIFVFPTLADEWGVVVNEAMASGLPVIGSVRSQAVQELVTPGESGFTFDPLGARAQRLEAIDKIVTSAGLSEMGCRARSIAGRIAPADAAESIVSLIRGLASDSAR